MALVACPECKSSISTEADSCPNCGYPISKLKNESNIPVDSKGTFSSPHFLTLIKKINRKTKIIIGSALIIAIALSFVLVHEYKLTPEEKVQVQSVYDQIEEISKFNNLQEYQILEPEKDYLNLTTRLQRRVSNRSVLLDARKRVDQSRADVVISAISRLGSATLESKDDIDKIQQAYDALSNNQKSLVSNYNTFSNSVDALNKLKIDNVIDLISKIGTVSLDSQQTILNARSAYEELGAEQKESIENYDLLVSAEVEYENLAVSELNRKISEIGEVALESEDNIAELEFKYKSLSSGSQQKVSNYSLLEAARTNLDELISQKKLEEKTTELRNIVRIFKFKQSSPNSAGGVDVFIGFTNESDKTIKYISFTVTPYNAVGDITYSQIGNESTISLQDTGPYQKGKGLSGTYSRYWECMWYTWDINTIKLDKINIEYTDGSTEAISGDDVNLVIY